MQINDREELYHRDCPYCEQDVLAIVEDLVAQRLFLWCGECDATWLAPEDVGKSDVPSVPSSERGRYRNADGATIRRFGWDRYKVYCGKQVIFDGAVPSKNR
jgi:hypothetical protein